MNGVYGIGWTELLLLLPFLALFLWALIDVIRRPQDRMRHLPKWAWVLIVVFGNTLGQIVYLVIGRENAKPAEQTQGADRGTVDKAVDSLYGPAEEPHS